MKKPMWQGTEVFFQQPGTIHQPRMGATLEEDPPAPAKHSDNCSLGKHPDLTLKKDPQTKTNQLSHFIISDRCEIISETM